MVELVKCGPQLRASAGRLALWLAWLVPLCIYVLSAYHDVGFWDVGEMDTVPWILGIAHPTGFPAFVLGGWVFTHVFAIGTVAFRMSVFSALSMSGAAWLIARTVDEEFDAPWIGAACGVTFALGMVAWTRATRAEVHALATLAIAATIYFTLRWYRTNDARSFVFGAIAWAVGVSVHPVASLLLAGLLVFFVACLHRLESRTPAIAIVVFACIVAAFYAYLPLRSAYVTAHVLDPTRALGVPAGRPFWDYDHPSTVAGFRALVSGSDFDVSGGLHSIVSPDLYIRQMPKYFALLLREYAIVGVVLAALGVIVSFARDRVRAAGLLLCGFVCIPFALGYSVEGDAQRYFLTSFVVCAIFAGEGMSWLAARARWTRSATTLAMGAACVWLVGTQRHLFTQPHDDRATAAVATIVADTPPNALIIANWIYATPLAYRAYVVGDFGHRTVEAAWMGDDAQYLPRWIAERPVYVVGPVSNDVPGVGARRIAAYPPIYRLVKQ